MAQKLLYKNKRLNLNMKFVEVAKKVFIDIYMLDQRIKKTRVLMHNYSDKRPKFPTVSWMQVEKRCRTKGS